MELRDLLQEAVEKVPGARYAGICGIDGLPVETWSASDDGEAAVLGPEISNVLTGFLQKEDGGPGPTALMLELADGPVFARVIDSDYFVFMATGPEAFSGRARHMLRRIVPRLADLL